MCAHASADEQFRLFGVIPSNPDFPLICLKAIPEAVRQNPDSKAWNQACDQGAVLLSTASVKLLFTYAHSVVVIGYVFHT